MTCISEFEALLILIIAVIAAYQNTFANDTGEMTLVFFHSRRDWLEKNFPLGERRLISGKIEWFNDRPQMVHPDYSLRVEEAAQMPSIEPIYPLTAGLSAKLLQKAIKLTQNYKQEAKTSCKEVTKNHVCFNFDFYSCIIRNLMGKGIAALLFYATPF